MSRLNPIYFKLINICNNFNFISFKLHAKWLFLLDAENQLLSAKLTYASVILFCTKKKSGKFQKQNIFME